jgi:hypothetical protein
MRVGRPATTIVACEFTASVAVSEATAADVDTAPAASTSTV